MDHRRVDRSLDRRLISSALTILFREPLSRTSDANLRAHLLPADSRKTWLSSIDDRQFRHAGKPHRPSVPPTKRIVLTSSYYSRGREKPCVTATALSPPSFPRTRESRFGVVRNV